MTASFPIANHGRIACRIVGHTPTAGFRPFVFTLCLLIATPAHAAGADDKSAVLATAQEFFDALAAKSEARLMATVVPEGRISSHRARDGVTKLGTQGWAEWAKSLAGATEALEERMHSPKVRVKGTIASVWTEYSFHRDGRFSHCGIDVFDMAKLHGKWKIVNLSYSVETRGCPKR